jgi:hypothetical protein
VGTDVTMVAHRVIDGPYPYRGGLGEEQREEICTAAHGGRPTMNRWSFKLKVLTSVPCAARNFLDARASKMNGRYTVDPTNLVLLLLRVRGTVPDVT